MTIRNAVSSSGSEESRISLAQFLAAGAAVRFPRRRGGAPSPRRRRGRTTLESQKTVEEVSRAILPHLSSMRRLILCNRRAKLAKLSPRYSSQVLDGASGCLRVVRFALLQADAHLRSH